MSGWFQPHRCLATLTAGTASSTGRGQLLGSHQRRHGLPHEAEPGHPYTFATNNTTTPPGTGTFDGADGGYRGGMGSGGTSTPAGTTGATTASAAFSSLEQLRSLRTAQQT